MMRNILLLAKAIVLAFATASPAVPQETDAVQASDPYKDIYRGYVPDFIEKIERGGWGRAYYEWKRDEETMKL